MGIIWLSMSLIAIYCLAASLLDIRFPTHYRLGKLSSVALFIISLVGFGVEYMIQKLRDEQEVPMIPIAALVTVTILLLYFTMHIVLLRDEFYVKLAHDGRQTISEPHDNCFSKEALIGLYHSCSGRVKFMLLLGLISVLKILLLWGMILTGIAFENN